MNELVAAYSEHASALGETSDSPTARRPCADARR